MVFKNVMYLVIAVILIFGQPIALLAQYSETEPNDTQVTANILSLDEFPLVSAKFEPAGDVDYFVIELQEACMYYLTSVENDAGVAPNVELFRHSGFYNILTSDVGTRNGRSNFRLSGYVPDASGNYYAKIFNTGGTEGSYKVRFAGGRCAEELRVHEPDDNPASVYFSAYLAQADTVYGAIYPENDIDYYKISGIEGEQYTIGTRPILDLDVRDTDTYITLLNSLGTVFAKNDDIGQVSTPSGSVNCTFSKMTGIFPYTGDYYISVRSFYNTNFDEAISERNPPMGEYGLYYISKTPEAISRYPHVELPTVNSVLVQWNTINPQSTRLVWGENESLMNTIQDSTPVHEHLVKIKDLAPESKYYYRVIAENDSSDLEYFFTAKPASTKNVKFFVISDSSPYQGFGSTPAQLEVAEQIQQVEYDFGLHAGDVNQHHGEEYDLVFYQPYKKILKNAPIFPCVGNHDTVYDNAQTYMSSFNLPYNNPDSTERYYSLNYGHAHFISLDTNLPYNPGSAQYEWLINDLESDMRRETDWTFIHFHHPPWSEGWADHPGREDVRIHLVPLFEDYQVDMIFNGHTHDYERGFLNGVYYIITGGGGAPLDAGIQAYDFDHVTVFITQHHFTYIQLDKNSMKLQAINLYGEIIDEFIHEKPLTGVDEDMPALENIGPNSFHLYNSYPNPFNNSTRISFDLSGNTSVHLAIHDINGREVRSLASRPMTAGNHQIEWNGRNNSGAIVASGVYIVKLQTSGNVQNQRTVFLK